MSNTNILSARQRIDGLVDENSFVEIGAGVTARSTDFNMGEKTVPADGVITGYGLIQNNPVYIYSQDATGLAGTIGEMHAKKITQIYDLAMKTGTPVIGLIDCAGMRLQESVDALDAFGSIYAAKAKASGVIPQISAVFGKCGGGVAVMAAMSDFTYMEKENARFFVNSPNVLEGNYIEKNDTSSADFVKSSSVPDVIIEGEQEVLDAIRELITILPANNGESPVSEESLDELNRELDDIEKKLSDNVSEAIEEIGDNNFFLELKKDYAKDVVTGFILLDGMTVGVVANNETRLTTNGCQKATDFVNLCDSFNIPILTLTNVEGYAATVEEEAAVALQAAKLTAAFAEADVPKVNLIVGNAYGSAYVTMNSKHIGADVVFALPKANIGMMDAGIAAKIIYEDDKDVDIAAKTREFETAVSVDSATARGYVDQIIEPANIRKQLLYAFEMLFTKSGYPLGKKHRTK